MNARLMAGVADRNASLFRRLRVPLGDPAAWIELDEQRIALVRDLEMDRVREHSTADAVTCPAEHAPTRGLSSDRETATAEAVAELLRSRGVSTVIADRMLPLIFSWHLREAGIAVQYDAAFGVLDRRSKSQAEIDALAKAQQLTEEVMQITCEKIATATADRDGILHLHGQPLTSERLKSEAAIEFLNRNCSLAHGAIIATAPQVADCHHSGEGPLRTGVPVIVDLFPRHEASRYWGDCTRTVLHGEASDTVRKMHAAVLEAKSAATSRLQPTVPAGDVHRAAEDVLIRHGFQVSRGTITNQPTIQHGTGHGIGLDLHEPILLDEGGEAILEGEVFTIEPGLYGRHSGGVRIEDMVVASSSGPVNLNQLHDGLDWRT